MKVLYLISTIRSIDGNGGHYYSLKSTVTALQDHQICVVVNLGRFESLVVNSLDIATYNVVYKKFSPFKMLKDLQNIVEAENPDVIHCFDIHAYFFAHFIAFKSKLPLILTKCGGPNTITPTNYFPRIKNIILYSLENKRYFENNKKYRGSNIYLIPNRINDVKQDNEIIRRIKSTFDPDTKIFLRISRISGVSRYNLLQSVHLIQKLNEDGYNVRLLIVGLVQDRDVYGELSSITDESVLILTDEEYTVGASKLIDVADFVIGTGRSFMEASSRGKVLLCPMRDSSLPLLITGENFFDAFETNFSDRTSVKEFDPEDNYANIVKALNDPGYFCELSGSMKSFSKEYFELETVTDRYLSLYRNLSWTKDNNIVDLVIQFAMLVWFSRK